MGEIWGIVYNVMLQGNFFTSVCQEFCPWGGGRGMRGWGGCACRGVCMAGVCIAGACMAGASVAGETATAADGTHPTGMHSCIRIFYISAKCPCAKCPRFCRIVQDFFSNLC